MIYRLRTANHSKKRKKENDQEVCNAPYENRCRTIRTSSQFPHPPTSASGWPVDARSNCCQLLFAVYFAPFCCSSTVAFIIHRSSYCGGRSTQLQRNGPSRLHWRVTLQLYIDGYTAKRKRESRWASERACTSVRFRLCVRRNAKWTRHATGRGLSRGSLLPFSSSPFFFFFYTEGVLCC